jgi:putative addiction module component (TIGR02574 family)
MSSHPPRGLLADALQLPAQDRLALASELIDSVEGANDAEWDAAWLAELDRRSQGDLSKSDDWAMVRARILNDLRSK